MTITPEATPFAAGDRSQREHREDALRDALVALRANAVLFNSEGDSIWRAIRDQVDAALALPTVSPVAPDKVVSADAAPSAEARETFWTPGPWQVGSRGPVMSADAHRDLKEVRYEMAEKAVVAAERGVDLAKKEAERIVREARHEAYLAYCERNAAMKALGIHPDQIVNAERIS